jgi:hypothetical protein
MFKQTILALGLLMSSTLTGCSCDGTGIEASDEELISEARISSLTYYMVADVLGPDGVIYVRALNQAETWCLGNTYSEACPVEELEFVHSGLDRNTAGKYTERFLRGYGIVEGWMENVSDHRGNYVSKLFIVNPWDSAIDEEPMAPLYEVTPVDIYCIRAPCPTLNAQLLNHDDSSLLHGVDLEASGANDQDVVMGYQLLHKQGILIAGEFAEVDFPAALYTVMDDSTPVEAALKSDLLPGSRIVVSQTFYTPVR